MTEFYDGFANGEVDWEEQYIKVDSFKYNRAPFRLVYYPFYTKINEIIKYTLTTKDSILTEFLDYGDSVFFSLKIINKHTYFHIKPTTITNEYIPEKTTSQFDIWFKKSDNMPYRMRSKWHHATSFEECTDARFNTTEVVFFKASEYFPEYFKIRELTRAKRKPRSDMVGKKAPDWILRDIDIQDIKLSDLKSSVLLIQFTGIGCGPCHKSIPFLNQLADEYKDKDFELLSIETWSNNMTGIKRYVENNGINFKFLNSTDEVNKSYQISSVPTFFIIDKDRVIRRAITGYSKEKTDKEIRDAIDEFL
jgi:thiol-disulfide isomerase/thioredoxin